MKFSDYLRMAFHNIWRQKLRSILTIFAIVIGATSVTIMLTIVFSAKGFITSQFESNGTFQQIQVSPEVGISWGSGTGSNCNGGGSSDCIKLTDPLIHQIGTLSHMTGIARETQVNNFDGLFYKGTKLRLNQVVAYDANGILKSTILAGRDINPNDGDGVLTITSDYADALGFKRHYQDLIGKTVTLHSGSYYSGVGSNPLVQYQYMQQNCSNMNPGQNCSPPPTEIDGTIVGIASTGGPAGGGSNYTVRVPLSWARGMEENQTYTVTQASQQAASYDCAHHPRPNCAPQQPAPTLITTDELAQNGYSALVVKVDQASNAALVAKNIRNQFKLGAADAETAIKQQLAVFNILGIILGGIGGIALVVAAVGVVNTMIMSILERTREIGVMRAVGARRSTVSRLFTFEASLLGLFGGIVGIGLGYILTLIGNPLINRQLKGNGISSSNILSLPPWLILAVIIGTTIIGMLAGLYPARRAAKLDPVEALHYE
ncbi:MAG TPA: ABC transporter permease [Candidatus Saccharimonadales bacterium]|nr:ABC transporter permease [Candidatus Saccharimonadales bacterium]